MNENNDFYNQNRDENEERANEQNGNWGNNSSGENEYFYNQTQMPPKPKTLGWSVASMVVGILSVVCCCFGYTGIIFGLGAIILSIVARKSLGYFEGMAIAGLVLGIFGFVFGVAIVWNIIFNKEFIDNMNQYYTEFYNSGEM